VVGPVYKLHVYLRPGQKKKPEQGKIEKSTLLHPGVTCDGCEKPVKGFRYKCMVCEDYDLCSKCEAEGKHPGHNMVRIAAPPPHGCQWGSSSQGRGMFRGRGRGFGLGAGWGSGGPAADWNFSTNVFTAPAFEAMLKGWMGEGCQAKQGQDRTKNAGSEIHKKSHGEACGLAKEAHEQAHAAAEAMANAAHEAAAAAAHEVAAAAAVMSVSGSSADYLQNVGSFVSAALDPLGIDVQVHVDTPTVKKNEEDKSEKPMSSSSDEDDEWTVVSEKKKSEVDSIETQEQKATEPEKEKEKMSEVEEQATVAKMDVDKQEASGSAPFEYIQQEEAATMPATPVHPDPKIQVAVQAMMNMGFTNEGGWLANLLEVKNGDIGKVLDILQPVRK